MKEYLSVGFIFFVFVILLVSAFQTLPESFVPLCAQCCSCEPFASSEDSVSDDYDELFLEEGQVITEIWIKAGQGCFNPDGVCYNVTEGGIGFDFVKVERIGSGPNCQGISHLEVCYIEQIDPSDTPTYTPTEEIITDTPTPTEVEPSATPTNTPEDQQINSPTPTSTDTPTDTPMLDPTHTPSPYPTSSGNGLG